MNLENELKNISKKYEQETLILENKLDDILKMHEDEKINIIKENNEKIEILDINLLK